MTIESGMLLVTDTEPVDDSLLYPHAQGVTAATSSLVWMRRSTDDMVSQGNNTDVGTDGTWSGSLSFHSGVVVFADEHWSHSGGSSSPGPHARPIFGA